MKRISLVLGLLYLLAGHVQSQEYKDLLYSVNVGYAAELFSAPTSIPFTINADVRNRFNDLTAIVGGLAFNYTDNDRVDGFFSRSEVNIYYSQIYGGVRFYATNRVKPFQFFGGLNIGVGSVYKVEGEFSNEESGFAVLGGANINLGAIVAGRFIIGTSADLALNASEVGYIFFNFKVGYQFGL